MVRHLSPAERQDRSDRMVRMYVDEKLSLRKIADAEGCAYGTVHRMLKDRRVTFRPRGFARADG
ncbi:helix-turn-helix domain-containing protein [Streptoverticillium reticulum]|uniref:helix-turn-helix domain-containing protein n=1 Tax=Streptoverticillium reticulum TaxID=1433415 RepID=UPI0039BFA9C8